MVIDVDWMTTVTKLQLGHDLKLQQYTSNDGCGVGRGNVLQCNYCVILHIMTLCNVIIIHSTHYTGEAVR